MQRTSQSGMQTCHQSLYDLWTRQLITREDALKRASNRDELRLRMDGIASTAAAAQEQMEDAMRSGGEQGQGSAADEIPGLVRSGEDL